MELIDYAAQCFSNERDIKVAVGAVIVVRYFDSDGEAQIALRFDGDQDTSSTVGMLEAAKWCYLKDQFEDSDA